MHAVRSLPCLQDLINEANTMMFYVAAAMQKQLQTFVVIAVHAHAFT
jgi:hypothetical protein